MGGGVHRSFIYHKTLGQKLRSMVSLSTRCIPQVSVQSLKLEYVQYQAIHLQISCRIWQKKRPIKKCAISDSHRCISTVHSFQLDSRDYLGGKLPQCFFYTPQGTFFRKSAETVVCIKHSSTYIEQGQPQNNANQYLLRHTFGNLMINKRQRTSLKRKKTGRRSQ